MGQTVKSKLWEGKNAGGSGGAGGDGTNSTGPIITPGGGGTITTAQLISGNFGQWTSLTGRTSQFIDTIELKFKSDLQAFATRSITYLQGQFSLNAAFTGTSLRLGTIGDSNSFPIAMIQKYIIVANVEMFLEVDTAGNISLVSKDGLNLPVNNAGEPYYIDTFWHPGVAYTPLPTYTATRTANFTRNNCGSGTVPGVAVSFTKTYTSNISQIAANALAASDGNFNSDGQAYANANGTCLVVYTATRTENFTRNNCGSGYQGSVVSFSRTYTSTVSQADANAQASGDSTFEAAGQANANASGTCAVIYTANNQSTFQKNDCGSGYTGSNVFYIQYYTSIISQADANAQALADTANFNEAGQANANANGTCTLADNAYIFNHSATQTISILSFIKDGGGTTTFNNIAPGGFLEEYIAPGTYTVSVKTSTTTNFLSTTVNGVTKDNTDGFDVHSFYPVTAPFFISIQDS
ncbi:MAG: DUF5977 domain-containing protein [Mucilaginibacter sp.]